jgi:hypothetical protein
MRYWILGGFGGGGKKTGSSLTVGFAHPERENASSRARRIPWHFRVSNETDLNIFFSFKREGCTVCSMPPLNNEFILNENTYAVRIK